MKQILIIFTFIFLTLLSHAQEGFEVVVDRPQEFVETYGTPTLEFTKNKIFCMTSASYRTLYGKTGFLDQFDHRDNLEMDQLNESQKNTLVTIADHKSQGGFMAQSILSQYYGYEFPIYLEPDQSPTQQLAKKANIPQDAVGESLLSINPNPVVDEILVQYGGALEKDATYKVLLISSDGRCTFIKLENQDLNNVLINISQLVPGIYTVSIQKDYKEIAHNRFIKK